MDERGPDPAREVRAPAERPEDRPAAAVTGDSYVDELRQMVELVERGDLQSLDHLVAVLHAHDLAKLFVVLPRSLWPDVIARLDIGRISDLMEELPDHLRDDLAEHLLHEQLRTAIGEMASDDAADVLADLPAALARDLIEALPRQDRRDVEALLKYPEDSAGGLMQLELLAVPDTHTVADAIETLRANADEVSTFHFVYVVDDRHRLVGVLNLGALLLAPPEQPIAELMKHDVHTVGPEVDQEQVARLFRRYDLVALPVVDSRGRLLGRILHDDVVDVLEEEADEDMMHMAGAAVFEPELVYTDQVLKIASVRLPWLLATLAGLTVPALLVAAFQVSFPTMMTLVPFIPVIGAMGGNIGAQSSTIIVRGFATGRVDLGNLGHFLLKELMVGLLMGLACGALVAVVASLWRGDPRLSVTVALSMLMAMATAAMLGVVVPYFFRLIRIDPAIAAGPLVTTINDTTAISIYYLAALVLVGR